MGLLDYTSKIGEAGVDTANILSSIQQTEARQSKLPGELTLQNQQIQTNEQVLQENQAKLEAAQRANEAIDIDVFKKAYENEPELYDYLYNQAAAAGYVENVGGKEFIRRGNAGKVRDLLINDHKVRTEAGLIKYKYMVGQVDAIDTDIAKIDKQLANPELPLNTRNQLQNQKNTLTENRKAAADAATQYFDYVVKSSEEGIKASAENLKPQKPVKETIHTTTLDLADPNGVKHPGGTVWDLNKGKPGDPNAYVGPGKATQTSASQVYQDEGTLTAAAQAYGEGRMSPRQIPARGGDRTRLIAKAQEIYPKFDATKAEANYNFQLDKNNLQTIARAKSVLPRLNDLEDKANALGNISGAPAFNRPLNEIKKEFAGNVNLIDYETLRNDMIQQVGVILSGSNVVTDHRIELDLAGLKSSNTPAQIIRAIRNLKESIAARTDASRSVPHPWEVVRGDITQEEYDKQQKKLEKQSSKAADLRSKYNY